jgi:hypothetical protein
MHTVYTTFLHKCDQLCTIFYLRNMFRSCQPFPGYTMFILEKVLCLMGSCLSSETTSCSDTQEILSILWNPEVDYRVNNSPLLVSILIHIRSYMRTISLRFILILSSHLPLHFLSRLFPLGFTTKTLYTLLFRYWPMSVLAEWLDLYVRL